MKLARKIELLSPAKNLECGMEAINHGADAVYIGAPQFSARSAAGNSIRDIETLSAYAHSYHAKVYVALNTILRDEELPLAEKMIREIYEAGADALIVQDMGILELDLPPIALHASTQCDNRSTEKVRFLQDVGFSQVVLARELSLQEIREIAENTQAPLEVFIHGALCVSYSGQCYISQALSERSANRGECAQYCRMAYSLQDGAGKNIMTDKHLLSLKDLNLSAHLEELLDAGVYSLKIEGRLKDLTYVKNITAFYRSQLDAIFERRPEYIPSSSGKTEFFFAPNPEKSFNRGFTDYFLKGRQKNIVSFDSPKSMGEPVGNIKDLGGAFFTLNGARPVHNGDGLCFLDEKKELKGFRVNKVDGPKIFPHEMPRLQRGVALYRNYDHDFEKNLLKKSAERKISLDWILEGNNFGFSLTARDEDDHQVTVSIELAKELSQKDQKQNIQTQLSKLGNTIFTLNNLQILFSENWFIPSSVLSDLKRKATERLLSVRKIQFSKYRTKKIHPTSHPYPESALSYLGNVANEKAAALYRRHGVEKIDKAFELYSPEQVPLMFAKHCLRYSLGYCRKIPGEKQAVQEPLHLISGNKKLRLDFDCEQCLMKVF